MSPMAIAEQSVRVAELRAGSEVEGVFACTRKDRLTAKSGTPYLAVELRDRSGAIQARAFREDDFLGDEGFRAELRRAPCTRSGHHAYLGGLLEHTVAVGTLALEACVLHPRLNSDLLICAALLHDIGKTREFTYAAEIGLSEEGRLLGHVVLGQRMLDERAGAMSEQ